MGFRPGAHKYVYLQAVMILARLRLICCYTCFHTRMVAYSNAGPDSVTVNHTCMLTLAVPRILQDSPERYCPNACMYAPIRFQPPPGRGLYPPVLNNCFSSARPAAEPEWSRSRQNRYRKLRSLTCHTIRLHASDKAACACVTVGNCLSANRSVG